MASDKQEGRWAEFFVALSPALWIAFMEEYAASCEWFEVYVWLGLVLTMAVMVRWVKQWSQFRDVLALLRVSLERRRHSNWSRFRGAVRLLEGDQVLTTKRKSGPLWSYPLKNGFFALELDNGVRMPIQVGRAWSFEQIKDGQRVTIWGYFERYFKAFWIDRSPRLWKANIWMRSTYWNGIYGVIILGYAVIVVSGLAVLEIVPLDVLQVAHFILLSYLMFWLVVYVVSWLIWLIAGVHRWWLRKQRRKKAYASHKQKGR